MCYIVNLCSSKSVCSIIYNNHQIHPSPSLEHTRPKLPGTLVEEVVKVKNDWVASEVCASHIGATFVALVKVSLIFTFVS